MTTVSAAPEPRTRRSLAGRLFREYLAPHWKGLALALACAAAVAMLSATLGALMNPVVKRIFEQKRMDSLLLLTGLIVLCGVMRGVLQVVQSAMVNRIGHRVVGEMQVALFGKLLRADLQQLRSGHSGGYVSSVLYDANLIREAATSGVVNYTREGLTVVFALCAMAYQDVYLTVIVLVAAPVAGWVMRRFSKRTRKAAQGAMNETGALSTAIMESLDGVKLVKIDNREAYEEARVAAVVGRRQKHVIKGANIRAAAAPVTETLTVFVMAAVIFYAGYRATQGQMTIGRLTAFLILLGMASQSLRQVANLQTVFAEGLTAAGRLFEALDVKATIEDRPGARPLTLSRGAVAFEGVGFGYAPGIPALSDVTLHAGRGETVALVGPSGSGKSTLLNLIPRFFEVSEGRVSIDGADVRDVTLASLRAQIALVTQEPFLFDESIRANIAYARPEAGDAEIEAAARAAHAHDFITDLPQGYLTQAGEAGARLSGGQRQRIAIARAFLKDAPILLLDEATSALDTESEAKVQAALEQLMAGRTTLLVAHRLSTVRRADRIYVLEAGRVVESGTHASLLVGGGLYARLAQSQHLDAAPPPEGDAFALAGVAK
jgi:subfamily B ATP-binding cassette protein MsbA